jgi:hypothetical protein
MIPRYPQAVYSQAHHYMLSLLLSTYLGITYRMCDCAAESHHVLFVMYLLFICSLCVQACGIQISSDASIRSQFSRIYIQALQGQVHIDTHDQEKSSKSELDLQVSGLQV